MTGRSAGELVVGLADSLRLGDNVIRHGGQPSEHSELVLDREPDGAGDRKSIFGGTHVARSTCSSWRSTKPVGSDALFESTLIEAEQTSELLLALPTADDVRSSLGTEGLLVSGWRTGAAAEREAEAAEARVGAGAGAPSGVSARSLGGAADSNK